MNSSRRGFTIIETMLVLAITGLVAAVVLVSIGTGLRNQQYQTAVDQIYDYFQGQYSLSSTILNDRSASDTCSSAGISTDAGGTGRGTSKCFILGKVIRSETYVDVNGSKHQRLNSYAAIAREDVSDLSQFPNESDKTVKQMFIDANIVAGADVTPYELANESDVKLRTPSGSVDNFALTLLVVRSPLSGQIYTYYVPSSQATVDINSMTEADLKVCIDPNGLINTGISPSGILIEKSAANASGVQLLSSGECV